MFEQIRLTSALRPLFCLGRWDTRRWAGRGAPAARRALGGLVARALHATRGDAP
jgi:hypothetical protein